MRRHRRSGSSLRSSSWANFSLIAGKLCLCWTAEVAGVLPGVLGRINVILHLRRRSKEMAAEMTWRRCLRRRCSEAVLLDWYGTTPSSRGGGDSHRLRQGPCRRLSGVPSSIVGVVGSLRLSCAPLGGETAAVEDVLRERWGSDGETPTTP